jgi:hypothetical protein
VCGPGSQSVGGTAGACLEQTALGRSRSSSLSFFTRCYDSYAIYTLFFTLLYFDASRTNRPALADPLSLLGHNATPPIPVGKVCALSQVHAHSHSIRQVTFPQPLSHLSCAFPKSPPDLEIPYLRLIAYSARHTIYSAVYLVHCLVYMTLSDSCR